MPSADAIASGDLAEAGSLALYFELLRGVHTLARQLLSGEGTSETESAISIFPRVRELSVGGDIAIIDGETERFSSTFSGPHHLASLLTAVASDLTDSAVANIPPPSGVDPDKWGESMQRVARARPYPGKQLNCFKLIRDGKIPDAPPSLSNSSFSRLIIHSFQRAPIVNPNKRMAAASPA